MAQGWRNAPHVPSKLGNTCDPMRHRRARATYTYLPGQGARQVAMWNGTTWSPAVTVVPATSSNYDGLYALTCPSAGDCVAVTGAGEVVTSAAGSWSPPRDLATGLLLRGNFPSLSCPTTTDCSTTMSPNTVGTFKP